MSLPFFGLPCPKATNNAKHSTNAKLATTTSTHSILFLPARIRVVGTNSVVFAQPLVSASTRSQGWIKSGLTGPYKTVFALNNLQKATMYQVIISKSDIVDRTCRKGPNVDVELEFSTVADAAQTPDPGQPINTGPAETGSPPGAGESSDSGGGGVTFVVIGSCVFVALAMGLGGRFYLKKLQADRQERRSVSSTRFYLLVRS